MGTRQLPKSLTLRKPKRAEITAHRGPTRHGFGTDWAWKTSMTVNGLPPEMARPMARIWHEFGHGIGTEANFVQSIQRSHEPEVIRIDIEEHCQGRSAALLNGEVLAIGHGAVICAAARKLIKRGVDPAERLEAWRGNTLCLSGPVSSFAKLGVADDNRGTPRFVSYRPGPATRAAIACGEAAPVAQNDRPLPAEVEKPRAHS
jgi:hypothetical protein